MKCDFCNKQAATVHLTEIVDGVMTEKHLCEECARQKSAQMEQQFGLSDLLAGMAEFGKPAKGAEGAEAKCPACGLTYADFKKIGRLGCGSCYGTFRKYLIPLLKRIHGSNQHLGKTPLQVPRKVRKKEPARPAARPEDLSELRQRMQKAIETEAFEEAAKIRDQIKALEKQVPQSE